MTTKTRKQQLQEMLLESPTDAFLRYGLGMEFASEGNDAEAVRQFREVFTHTPEYLPSYQQAGQALVRLGLVQDAGEILRKGMAIARQQGDLHAAEEMQGLLASIGD